MARLTGQYTIPSFDSSNNKIFTPFNYAVVFVFTDGTRKVERSTNANGSYSFDLVNGKYEVSVYLKASKDKERFDLRAGEVFEVTSSTQADALDKWMQVIGDAGKDELQLYYENLLKQMNEILEKAKAEADRSEKALAEKVGDGPLMGVGAYGVGESKVDSVRLTEEEELEMMKNGGSQFYRNAIATKWNNYKTFSPTILSQMGSSYAAFATDFREGVVTLTTGRAVDPGKTYTMYSTANTAVDSNGFIKVASPVLKLTNSGIEYNDAFTAIPQFRKLDTGVYEISNTLGLAKEGWTIETPKDRHGRPYFHVIVQESFGRVVLSVHDEYEVRKTEAIRDIYGEDQEVEVVEKILGEARDIKPHERWIDLRFHEEPEEHTDPDEEWMKYLTPEEIEEMNITPEEIEEMNNPSVES